MEDHSKNLYEIKLKIADVVIQMHSKFDLEPLAKEEVVMDWRFKNFLNKSHVKPQISINVNIVNKFPQFAKEEINFVATHFLDGSEGWRLIKNDENFTYISITTGKRHLIRINNTFNEATAYLLPKCPGEVGDWDSEGMIRRRKQAFIIKRKGFVWNINEFIYNFLQVLLITYLAKRRAGIFVHGTGLRGMDGKGLLFVGESGSGKSTIAKIWNKYSRAMLLNDDRIIVRKTNNKFIMYSSTWYGTFCDYLKSKIEPVCLDKIFFIHHAPKNMIRKISEKEAFKLFLPNLFPTFWNKEGLENIISFYRDLIKRIPCFNLEFKNDKRIIDFLRRLN